MIPTERQVLTWQARREIRLLVVMCLWALAGLSAATRRRPA